jgi:hypothetical protein
LEQKAALHKNWLIRIAFYQLPTALADGEDAQKKGGFSRMIIK